MDFLPVNLNVYKSRIFAKTTKETGPVTVRWSWFQGLGLYRDAQGTHWARQVLENLLFYTYTKLYSQSFAASIGLYRWAAREHCTAYFRQKAAELGLTWYNIFICASIVMSSPPGRPGQRV